MKKEDLEKLNIGIYTARDKSIHNILEDFFMLIGIDIDKFYLLSEFMETGFMPELKRDELRELLEFLGKRGE